MAVQLRDAVVEAFPEVKVFLKPIDPHAPRNRARTGAFEVQMCFHSRFTSNHHKVLLFSKLQRGEFPDTKDLLHQLSELQAKPPAGGTSSWDPFEPKTKVSLPPSLSLSLSVSLSLSLSLSLCLSRLLTCFAIYTRGALLAVRGCGYLSCSHFRFAPPGVFGAPSPERSNNTVADYYATMSVEGLP